MNFKDLLLALDHTPHNPKARDNPYGIGHQWHKGFVVNCIGTQDADGNLVPESRHVIGILTAVPDAGAESISSERADEATFEVTQTDFDLTNPVCTICKQSIVL